MRLAHGLIGGFVIVFAGCAPSPSEKDDKRSTADAVSSEELQAIAEPAEGPAPVAGEAQSGTDDISAAEETEIGYEDLAIGSRAVPAYHGAPVEGQGSEVLALAETAILPLYRRLALGARGVDRSNHFQVSCAGVNADTAADADKKPDGRQRILFVTLQEAAATEAVIETVLFRATTCQKFAIDLTNLDKAKSYKLTSWVFKMTPDPLDPASGLYETELILTGGTVAPITVAATGAPSTTALHYRRAVDPDRNFWAKATQATVVTGGQVDNDKFRGPVQITVEAVSNDGESVAPYGNATVTLECISASCKGAKVKAPHQGKGIYLAGGLAVGTWQATVSANDVAATAVSSYHDVVDRFNTKANALTPRSVKLQRVVTGWTCEVALPIAGLPGTKLDLVATFNEKVGPGGGPLAYGIPEMMKLCSATVATGAGIKALSTATQQGLAKTVGAMTAAAFQKAKGTCAPAKRKLALPVDAANPFGKGSCRASLIK